MNYSLAYLSYNNSDTELKIRSQQILDKFFQDAAYAFNENEGQLLFVASGGSEQNAIERTKKHKDITLLCHKESNSYAATLEIAAYLRSKNKRVSIIDVFAPNALHHFNEVQKVNEALKSLAKQKAALIGEVSSWLIISDVETQLVKDKLGVELVKLSWDKLPNYQKKEVSQEFLSYFPKIKSEVLSETAKVYTLLKELVQEHNLSAISVECFSMVVRDKVTACLPLAVLNNNSTVAACEGDICAMLGKMLIRAIANEVPWQANVAEIKDEIILFAHCTAPLNVLKSFNVTTHFETNCGTAIQGEFDKQEVGVFRINNELSKYMLLQGEIIATPNHDFACRTQVEFKTSREQTQLLKNKSLGNHHLIFPSKYTALLERLMQTLSVTKVGV